MRARAAAREARSLLASAGVPDAAFESEYLLRVAVGLSRNEFFVNPELGDREIARASKAFQRRTEREPAAYISGTREFYGLAFGVSPAVLIPRPESEMLVDLALREAAGMDTPVIVDVGTGSGAIAVATAVALGSPGARVIGTDVSPAALAVAAANRDRHHAAVQLVLTDLTAAIERADIVLANLPYIPSDEIDALEPEVSQWEPRVALDGGIDGLDLIRRLIDECARRLRPRVLALEVGFGMAAAVRGLASDRGVTAETLRDLAGIERVVVLRWQ